MPIDGSGTYSVPSGTLATTATVIASASYNAFVNDLVSVLNTPVTVARGGTGVSTVTAFKTDFGLTPGTNILAYSTKIQAMADIASTADTFLYATGADTVATTDLSAFSRTALAAADASAFRTVIGALGTADLIEITSAAIDTGTDTTAGKVSALTLSGLIKTLRPSFVLEQQAVSGTHGGASGTSWTTRPISAEITDTDSIVSISSNQFTTTVPCVVEVEATFAAALGVRIQIYDVTAAAEITGSRSLSLVCQGYINVTSTCRAYLPAGTYEVRDKVESGPTNDFVRGYSTNVGDTEIYMRITGWAE